MSDSITSEVISPAMIPPRAAGQEIGALVTTQVVGLILPIDAVRPEITAEGIVPGAARDQNRHWTVHKVFRGQFLRAFP